MLITPARNATATASPVKIRGVAFERVAARFDTLPNAPITSSRMAIMGLSPVANINAHTSVIVITSARNDRNIGSFLAWFHCHLPIRCSMFNSQAHSSLVQTALSLTYMRQFLREYKKMSQIHPRFYLRTLQLPCLRQQVFHLSHWDTMRIPAPLLRMSRSFW